MKESKETNSRQNEDIENTNKTRNASVEPLPESTRPRRDGPGGE